MIVFQSVVKQFPDGTIALSDINLEIPEGQFVFIIGPSGAGKSTFLKLLTREIKPTGGSIRIGELELSKLRGGKIPALRKSLGVIFQDLRLLSDRTVFENIALTLEVMGVPKKEIADRTMQALEKVGLASKARLFPVQLSGGEAQRTAFARATIHNPLLLLADEPTADLDPKNTESLLCLLEDLNSEGTTIVLATHNAHIVNSRKKRVVALDAGAVVKDQEEGTYAV